MLKILEEPLYLLAMWVNITKYSDNSGLHLNYYVI